MRVCKESYPDFTQFDKQSHYYDPKTTEEAPRWFMVDVEFVKTFKRFVPLKELQKLKDKEELKDMPLLNRGRLSVQTVSKKAFDFICDLAERDPY